MSYTSDQLVTNQVQEHKKIDDIFPTDSQLLMYIDVIGNCSSNLVVPLSKCCSNLYSICRVLLRSLQLSAVVDCCL